MGRRAGNVVAALIVALLAAWLWELVWRNSFMLTNLDQVENYLMCYGQTTTGRPVPHGNNAAFNFGKLGPMVFYVYSLALLLWKSPLTLIFLSAALNVAAPIFILIFFKRRGMWEAGAIASCVMLKTHAFTSLVGETWPHAVLPFAVISWAILFISGIEKQSKARYALSFLLMSLATNSHISGFLLIPAGATIYLAHKIKIKSEWTEKGVFLFLAPYSVFLYYSWKNHWAPILDICRAAAGLVAGGGEGASLFVHFRAFASNYFSNLGFLAGAAFFAALIIGGIEVYQFYRRGGNKSVCEVTPWFIIQCAGLAGAFFASQEERYFIIYCVGSVVVTGILLARTPSIIKSVILPFSYIAVLALSVFNVFGMSFNNDASYFPLYSQVRRLAREKSFSPADIVHAHAIIRDGMNIGANMEWLTVLTAQYFREPVRYGAKDMNGEHYLFNFCLDSDDDLCAIVKSLFSSHSSKEYYIPFHSGLEAESCRLCASRDEADSLKTGAGECFKTQCAYRSDLSLSRYKSVYEYYPEMKRFRGEVRISPAVPGKRYELTGRLAATKDAAQKRLLIVQTNGEFGNELQFNEERIQASGEISRTLGNQELITYVWFILPADSGSFAIDWTRKFKDQDYSYNDVFLDIIDIEIPKDVVIPVATD